jgi:hypothetical protein
MNKENIPGKGVVHIFISFAISVMENNTNILGVMIVFLMAQVCMMMMIATPVARAAARPLGYNLVCCPRNIYCCGFGGLVANGSISSTVH